MLIKLLQDQLIFAHPVAEIVLNALIHYVYCVLVDICSIKINAYPLALLEHSLLRDPVLPVMQPVHLVQECKHVCHVYQVLAYRVKGNAFDFVIILLS